MERVGVAGSGTIACGLAATASTQGETLLWARSEKSAARATASLQKTCGRVEGADAERVRIVSTLEELADGTTFLIEAVAEEADIKTGVLSELAGHADEDAVIATTTSSLSVGELATASGAPERFVGFHVFNPVPRMKLIELAFADETTPAVKERARALGEALGKTVIEVPDTPGFVVNTLLFPFLFSAADFAAETGMPAADVDTCMMLGAGHPMGPLALLDYVGLDVSLAIGESIGATIPARLRELVDEGALGRKTKRGFLTYE